MEPVQHPSGGEMRTFRTLTVDEQAALTTATRQRVLEEAGLTGDPLAVRALSLDRICELVVRAVDAPTAHVSIVTGEDQRYAGAMNVLDPEGTNAVSHEQSWCKFVAVDREPLIIDDAAQHPMVDGSPAMVELGARSYAGVPLITPEGESLGALCAVDTEPHRWRERDIETLRHLAEWVMMEVQLRRQVHELERADRLKDDLVAMVTHELRTPLTTLVGSAQLLEAAWDEIPESKRREMASLMHRHGTRVNRIVDDLQTMVRVDAGELGVELEPVRLAPLVERIVGDVMPSDDSAQVTVAEELEVLADRGRVEQVLVNLLTNALKYGATPVTITGGQRGNEVWLRVTDSGDGVPSAFVDRLFERFARAAETSSDNPGSGLGLSIIRGFARAMAGDVRFVAPEGGAPGACFELVLPAT